MINNNARNINSPIKGGGFYYQLLIAVVWCQSLYDHFRGFLTHVPFIGDSLAPIVVPLFTLLLIFITRNYIKHFISIRDFVFVVVLLTVYVFNFIFYPQNEKILEGYTLTFMVGSLPFYIVGVFLNLDDYTDRVIYWSSICGLFILLLYYLFYVQNADYSGATEIMEDMMGPAYASLPFILIIVRKMLLKFDLLSFIISIIGFVFLLSFGARGPIACLLFFVVCYLLFLKTYSKPVLIKGIFFLIGLLSYTYINVIIDFLYPVMEHLGMGTRILDYMLAVSMLGTGETMDTSILERQDMFSIGVNYVNIFGHGIGSFSIVTHSQHVYSHNIIIDFLIEYGLIIGSILLLSIIWLFKKGWKCSKSEAEKSFLIVLFSIGIVSLLFSHTYIIKYEFFFAIGYCVHVIRESKKMKKRYYA